MKVFVFDSARCNGCYGCQVACKDEHVGNVWLPIANSQPDTGHFWCKMTQTDHGQAPKVRVEYTPLFCNHCDNAPCIEKYPEFFYKREDGLVILDPEKAQGHKEIMEDACPYGRIYWNDELQLAQKCTGCAHLVDQGELPHCVDVCATKALRFGEEEEFGDELEGAEFMAESEHGPRVYYLNRPHLFIAGDVWDPEPNEVVIGARVKLTLPDGSAKETETDWCGDFWFKRLDPGTYEVEVSAEGYKPMSKTIELDKSLNIGDFPLTRA